MAGAVVSCSGVASESLEGFISFYPRISYCTTRRLGYLMRSGSVGDVGQVYLAVHGLGNEDGMARESRWKVAATWG
jgi:hypothetical protein